MSVSDYDQVERSQKNAELVFGLVAPMGTDSKMVAENLVSQLREFHTESDILKLSDFIQRYSELLGIECDLKDGNDFERISTRISAANDLYRKFNDRSSQDEKNALLALAAAHHISSVRGKKSPGEALLDQAWVLVTLKRPEEVIYLRRIYGTGLHIIGLFATEEERVRHLVRKRHIPEVQATQLVKDDEDDRQAGGQRTRDAFHLADVFLDVGGSSDDWRRQLGRYLDLLFSHPYHTPTRDEQAMFHAYAASLRSAQLGRQVGAAITTDDGDIVSTGCNEVPKPGGGQYWDKDPGDERDHVVGCDSNDIRKNEILNEILQVLPGDFMQDSGLRKKIEGTSLFSITEFGRAVHAEMEAILSCARKGTSTIGKTLYTTAFPCHNCARHIIGAGIKRVVFIEPYPKSKAKVLHADAIRVGEAARCADEHSVPFVPFVGISPKKFSDMFTIRPVYSSEVDRKLDDGSAIRWQRDRTPLRTKMASLSYIDREARAIDRLNRCTQQMGLDLEGNDRN